VGFPQGRTFDLSRKKSGAIAPRTDNVHTSSTARASSTFHSLSAAPRPRTPNARPTPHAAAWRRPPSSPLRRSLTHPSRPDPMRPPRAPSAPCTDRQRGAPLCIEIARRNYVASPSRSRGECGKARIDKRMMLGAETLPRQVQRNRARVARVTTAFRPRRPSDAHPTPRRQRWQQRASRSSRS